eukprot:TRINITY_DN67231_c14_g4_i1.p3 TRINITY_DN67231_c14_g4~~TRINITY_DN67231_c14_g4_i1.p3  ORF type:complete len:148 (-),score=7.93 TRINITY_DN67231_c14_g4_i1:570-1013(-)
MLVSFCYCSVLLCCIRIIGVRVRVKSLRLSTPRLFDFLLSGVRFDTQRLARPPVPRDIKSVCKAVPGVLPGFFRVVLTVCGLLLLPFKIEAVTVGSPTAPCVGDRFTNDDFSLAAALGFDGDFSLGDEEEPDDSPSDGETSEKTPAT